MGVGSHYGAGATPPRRRQHRRELVVVVSVVLRGWVVLWLRGHCSACILGCQAEAIGKVLLNEKVVVACLLALEIYGTITGTWRFLDGVERVSR